MKILKFCLLAIIGFALFTGCKKTNTTNPAKAHLIFKFVYDSTQVRLNGFGQPDSTFPANHAGQNPHMNFMSAHYIEMTKDSLTALGSGTILYLTPTANGGAIDFQQEVLTPNGGTFYSVALDSVTPGEYKWLRVSLAYQNFSAKLYIDTTVSSGGYSALINQEFPCTVASFVGVNSYITTYAINNDNITVNGNRAQGYWGFQSTITANFNVGGQNYPYSYDFLTSGQAPGTTVVNPLFATSPIPSGSCVATGHFVANTNTGPSSILKITGNETQDIVVTVSLSVNHSFEWVEVNQDGKWQPSIGENIVDMGIRGLVPIIGH